MKKKMAALLALLTVCSTSMTALAATSPDTGDKFGSTTDITVNNTLEEAIERFVVPTSTAFTFALDPYQIVEENGQIYSPDLAVVNKSNVALQVTAEPYIVKTNATSKGLAVKKAANEVDVTGSGSTKDIYLEVVAATSIGLADGEDASVPAKQLSAAAGAMTGKVGTTPIDFTDGDADNAAVLKVSFDGFKAAAGNYFVELWPGHYTEFTLAAAETDGTKTAAALATVFGTEKLSIGGVTFSVAESSPADDTLTFTAESNSEILAIDGLDTEISKWLKANDSEPKLTDTAPGSYKLGEAVYPEYVKDADGFTPLGTDGDAKSVLLAEDDTARGKLTFILGAADFVTPLAGDTTSAKSVFNSLIPEGAELNSIAAFRIEVL